MRCKMPVIGFAKRGENPFATCVHGAEQAASSRFEMAGRHSSFRFGEGEIPGRIDHSRQRGPASRRPGASQRGLCSGKAWRGRERIIVDESRPSRAARCNRNRQKAERALRQPEHSVVALDPVRPQSVSQRHANKLRKPGGQTFDRAQPFRAARNLFVGRQVVDRVRAKPPPSAARRLCPREKAV